MRTLVIGSGGREHAIAWKLARSNRVSELLCASGNPGMGDLAECVAVPVSDLDGLVRLATERRVDLVVIGPDDPLAAGLADRFMEAGIPVAGPSAAAARIESSKAWAKEVMNEAGVPTARAIVVNDRDTGRRAIAEIGGDGPVVVKADGLALGKGVVVASNRGEAERALDMLLSGEVFGDAGKTVVIEECLTGMEVSVFAITDGRTVYPLVPACDYKRAQDGDIGPNTGGMGAYTPTGAVDTTLMAEIQRRVLEPTIQAMAQRDAPMRGVLYAGLMLTPDGVKVIEFNARFGDPETQVVLPTMTGDLGALLEAVAHGRLHELRGPSGSGAAVGVVLASGGYPGSYATGMPINGLERFSAENKQTLVFHAGTRRDAESAIVTAGGRVLTVVGLGNDLATAHARAYDAAERITFEGRHLRHDIARREL